LFEAHCALCHGETGAGGRGPNLIRPTLPHAPDDEQLAHVIRRGIPGSEMPGFWQLADREVLLVTAYVRSLGRVEPVQLPGDAARGRALYQKSGCMACHIGHGEGSGVGPELSDIGARRNAAYLRESLLQPNAAVPPEFLVVSVATSGGKTIRGVRLNEDSFTIQLRDPAGRFYSFRKADLASLKKEPGVSLMPSYESRLSAAQLDDLIAYLASLRGES